MKQLLFIAALFLCITAIAQVPAMPDAASVGQAAKGGAIAEAMNADSGNNDKALIDTTAISNPLGKEEKTIKRSNVLIMICSGGLVIVIIALLARRRRNKLQ